jgi:hypothetical protein
MRIRSILAAVLLFSWPVLDESLADTSPPRVETTAIGAKDAEKLQTLFRELIEDENRHDLDAVQSLLVDSPDSLFISKTEPLSKGDWGPYWGTTQVMGHSKDLYKGVFRIDPDYSAMRIVGLTPDVAELYVPIVITTDYSFAASTPTAARMVLIWVRTPRGWKMATDMPLPVVLPQPSRPPSE